jgi:hypothetical protein
MKAPVANGRPALWAIEIESPILLAKNGWSETTLNPGDLIRVQGFHDGKMENVVSFNRTITGAWTCGNTKGDFKIQRD